MSDGNVGFFGWLTLLFVALKLTGAVNWSWWWVLLPVWGWFALLLTLTVLVDIFLWFDRRR